MDKDQQRWRRGDVIPIRHVQDRGVWFAMAATVVEDSDLPQDQGWPTPALPADWARAMNPAPFSPRFLARRPRANRRGARDLKTAWFSAAGLLLAACGQGGEASDPHAGLDRAIRDWRVDLIAAEPACRGKTPEGYERCQQFEVSCKVEDPITEAERASGVTQKVLAAITWSQPDPAAGGQRPASATAVFSRGADGWTREAAEPVNLRTCARA